MEIAIQGAKTCRCRLSVWTSTQSKIICSGMVNCVLYVRQRRGTSELEEEGEMVYTRLAVGYANCHSPGPGVKSSPVVFDSKPGARGKDCE